MLGFLLSQQVRPTSGGLSQTDMRLTAESAVMPLESRIDALELACAGMWELLKFKFQMTDDELAAAINTVDARDGKVDGKITQSASETCPHCGRRLLTKARAKCVWCGAELARSPF